VQSVNFKQ